MPRYYRHLRELIGEDILRINSEELARRMGLTASQVRQDFAAIGAEGQQGYGYNVKNLYGSVGSALGITKHFRAVIVGNDGGLGLAVEHNPCFSLRGVTLRGLFADGLSPTAGGDIIHLPLAKAHSFCAAEGIEIAVICTTRDLAASTALSLYGAGVRGFWNLTSTEFSPPADAFVIETNPSDMLLTIACGLSSKSGK